MVLNNGTGITDQIDMLDKMIEVITSRNLTAVVVNAGGTGHAVGDIIEITATGSTSTIVAQLEVTSVAAGVIDGIRVYRGGAYTVDPSTTTGNAQSGTSGSGISATFDLTFSAASWSVNRRTQEAVSAAIGSGGTGYSVSDQLTVTLGSGVQGDGGADAVFNVDSVSGGVVTGVTVVSGSEGNYEEVPSNDVATTGGGGSGCTLTVTWGDPPQSRQDDQVAMLQGNGLAGADEIHVMIKTFTLNIGFNDAYNWGLLGATGYNNTLPIHQQAGVNSDQINTSTGALPTGDEGAYLVLKDNDADPDISWWINHNGRRIILICKVESGATTMYSSCYLGFLNQLATDTEYAYPLYIGGTTNDKDRLWTETSELTGGIVESIFFGSGDPEGPGYLKLPGGTWLAFAAETSSGSSTRVVETEFGIFPFINPSTLSSPNQTVATNSDVGWSTGGHMIIPASGVPGTETLLLKPTPGSGDDYYWLVAPIITRQENTGANLFPDFHNAYGELDNVFWFHNGGTGVVSEDRFVLGTKRYIIFQNGNRTQNWSYFALDED